MEQTLTARERINAELGNLRDLQAMQRGVDRLVADGIKPCDVQAYFNDRAARFEVLSFEGVACEVRPRPPEDIEDSHSHKKMGSKKFWDHMNKSRNRAATTMWQNVSAGTPYRVWLWLDNVASAKKSREIMFTHDYLAKAFDVSRWAVQDAVRELVKLGIIRIDRKGTVGRDGDKLPTTITLYPGE